MSERMALLVKGKLGRDIHFVEATEVVVLDGMSRCAKTMLSDFVRSSALDGEECD